MVYGITFVNHWLNWSGVNAAIRGDSFNCRNIARTITHVGDFPSNELSGAKMHEAEGQLCLGLGTQFGEQVFHGNEHSNDLVSWNCSPSHNSIKYSSARN